MAMTARTGTARPAFNFFNRRKLGGLLTHVGLIIVGALYIFPFLWMLGSSFKTPSAFFDDGLNIFPQDWHFENYSTAWTTANFGTYFGNTLFITLMTVAFTVLLTSMAGFVLARTQIPGKGLIIGTVLVLMFIPSGYTVLPIFEIVLWLHLNNTLWATILVETAGGMVINSFLFMGYFNTVHKEIEEAAVVDGAGTLRLYWNIMLPLSGPMAATVSLLTFMNSWNNFFYPLIFSLGNPSLRTLGVGMYAFVGENSRDWTLICAGAVISLLPIIVVFLFLQRYFVEAISGAVK